MLDTDETMILQIQAGHRELLELLIKKHYGTVYGYRYRRIGERSAAEDLTQDVFVRVVRNLDHYRWEIPQLSVCGGGEFLYCFRDEMGEVQLYGCADRAGRAGYTDRDGGRLWDFYNTYGFVGRPGI